MSKLDFIKGMNLSKAELESFEHLITELEASSKSVVNIAAGGGSVRFTPAAALTVAVAKFAYDLYKDYRHSWDKVADKDFENMFKNLIKDYHKLEVGKKLTAPSLDSYTTMRKAVLEAKKSAK